MYKRQAKKKITTLGIFAKTEPSPSNKPAQDLIESRGVGKTATAAALGDLLAQQGRRVLLLDLDPQSSLTQGLGIDAHGASLAEVIGGAKRGPLTLQKIIQPVNDRLDIAPADIALAGCELGMIERLGRENIVKGLSLIHI